MLNARSLGLGGGGAMFDPQISPRSPHTMFVASDRRGLYRTDNGGDTWLHLDERIVQGSSRFGAAFHPIDDKILAFHPRSGFVQGSHDPDASWLPILSLQAAGLKYPAVGMPMGNACSTTKPGIVKTVPRTDVVVTAAAYCPDDPGSFLIGTERGIARFDGQRVSWAFPREPGSNRASTFDDFTVPDSELGAGIANAADVICFLTLPDPMQAGRSLYFAATSCDILTSTDQGRTWTSIGAGLPGRSLGLVRPGRPQDTQTGPDPSYSPSRIRDFAGASGNGSFVLFATVSIVDELTLSSGGVWAYDGRSWRRAMGGQINALSLAGDTSTPAPTIPATAGLFLPRYDLVGASIHDPSTVYVTCQNTAVAYPAVYRGAYDHASNSIMWVPAYCGVVTQTQPVVLPQGGTIVRNVEPGWVERDFGWAFGGPARGFAVAPTDAGVAVFTNSRAVQVTVNGGANAGVALGSSDSPPNDWQSAYTFASRDPLPFWKSTGLDGTNVLNYYVRPGFDGVPDEHFAALSDIGFAQSIDAGDTWQSQRPDCSTSTPRPSCGKTPLWPHVYELAFGLQAGKNAIWAAASDLGGIPTAVSLDSPPDANGAVLLSLDDGDSWSALPTAGLPTGPITSVVRTDASIYVAVWFNKAAASGGVYRLDDGATSWALVGGAAPGRLPYRLALDPVNPQKLYCLVQGDGAGTRSGVYSQIGTGAWSAEGQIESMSPVDLIVNRSSATGEAELYLSSIGTPKTKNGDISKLVKGIWQPLGAFAPAPDNPTVQASGLFFFEDMAYASSLTHGVRCARRAEVESFDGSTPVDWIDYPAAPVDRVTRMAGSNDDTTGRSQLYLGTVGAGAVEVARRVYCVLNKSTFSREEFTLRANGASKFTYENVGWIVLDGFVPKELGVKAVADLNAHKPSLVLENVAGLSAGAIGNALVEAADRTTGILPPTVGQRIAYPFSLTIDLSQGDPFPAPPDPGKPPVQRTVFISGRSAGGHYAAAAEIELGSGPQPFLSDGPIGWLSADVCTFKVAPGSQVAFGQNLADGQPLEFLAGVLTHLNDPATTTASAEFDTMRDSGSVLQLATRENGASVYNFALARVHYLAESTAASDVSVFFRLFSASFTGFDYDRNGAYQLDKTGRVPLLGIKAGKGETEELVSIPCFGSPRVAPGSDMSLQTDPLNFHQAIPAKGSTDSVRYFGCWLDINQQTPRFPQAPGAGPGPFPPNDLKSIQELIRGRHQCLVVEVNTPDDPIPQSVTPQSSDKLGQRNLAIVDSDNPGSAATHTVQQPFEIRAPRPEPQFELIKDLTHAPAFTSTDELLFDWGNLPRDSHAKLFLPDMDVGEILALAAARHGPARFHRVDDHTFECSVGDLSYLPLSQNRTRNLVALLTIELPPTVKFGQEFRVVIRQVEAMPEFGEDPLSLVKRRVVGTFELRVPVEKAVVLVSEEERKLAVLKFVQRSLEKDDPWAAVFHDYVGQVAARVTGFGGDADAIPASPNGAPRDQPDQESCLRAAFEQLLEGVQAGDVREVLGAIRAGERCLESFFCHHPRPHG